LVRAEARARLDDPITREDRMELEFTKMHGLGNDFVVIDDLSTELDLDPDAVAWLCDRHFGVGGDGLILVRPATVEGADFLMLYYNADGSTAEMCGNGVRCFAKYVSDIGLVPGDRLGVQTPGAVYGIEIARDPQGRFAAATVDMGVPVLAPAHVPTTLAPVSPDDEAVIGAMLEVGGRTWSVTCVSMGNPHVVVWVDDVDTAPVTTVGPLIESHPAFPNKTNVEFATLTPEGPIRLRVWERGVGETLACGTGACATVVAASLAGLVDRAAAVELPGGELAVRWAEDGRVYMSGPAQTVFTGTMTLEEED
jgi:diaminopimelate epimerase